MQVCFGLIMVSVIYKILHNVVQYSVGVGYGAGAKLNPVMHKGVHTYNTKGPHGPKFSLIHTRKSFRICQYELKTISI
jgi:hypothetical protein